MKRLEVIFSPQKEGRIPDALPLVSVIIPSFNHAKFIRECIESVLSQDYAAIEIIVVDDGSLDGTLEILSSFGLAIRLLQQKGGRQARARNLALGVARGEFIAFLDSDDRYLPGRISSAVAAFHASPNVDVIWADFRLVNERGQVIAERRWRPTGADFSLELISGNPICNATVTVRRHVLDDIGGFDERVPRACDGAAWYQIAARGRRFIHLDRLTVDYRIHGENDSGRFVPMAQERDIALTAGAKAYLECQVIKTPQDMLWLRNVLVKQFSFHAAAAVQRALPKGLRAIVQARLLDGLGSPAGLWSFDMLRKLKHVFLRRDTL